MNIGDIVAAAEQAACAKEDSKKQLSLWTPTPPTSIWERIQYRRRVYENASGLPATKLFISIDFIEELLIETLTMSRVESVTKDPKKQNTIDGMTVYRVIEKEVIEVL